MNRYPKLGTRVVVTKGDWAGRQAKTEKTIEGRGRIELTLLGGAFKLGVAVPLSDVEPDPDRKVRKLPARGLAVGDRLFSLTGLVFPIGRWMTIKAKSGDRAWIVESDYSQPLTIQPSPGFEKRWALSDGHPLMAVPSPSPEKP